MITTVRYRVTRVESHGLDYADHIHGVADGAQERYLGTVGVGLPYSTAIGDLVEIDYDDTEDERGAPVAWRVVSTDAGT